MLVWQAHKGKIESAAFSPDGRLLATATGGTRLVYLWEPNTGKLVRKLDGDWPSGLGLGSVKSVCFAPQAPLLAAGTARSVTLWRADTLELLADLRHELAYELAFGRGAAPPLAAASGTLVGVWADPGRPTGDKPREPDHLIRSGGAASVDFSPDGKILATSSATRVVLWAAADGRQLRTLRDTYTGHRGTVRFSPDGRRVAMAYAKWVEVLPVGEGAGPVLKVQAGRGRFPSIWAVSWTADGRSFLTAGNDGAVRLWDAATGAELRSFEWGVGRLYCAAFSPDGLTCAACGEKGQVVVWDVDA